LALHILDSIELNSHAEVKRGLRWAIIPQVITEVTSVRGALTHIRLLGAEDVGVFGIAVGNIFNTSYPAHW
jgi:hypothetical protein